MLINIGGLIWMFSNISVFIKGHSLHKNGRMTVGDFVEEIIIYNCFVQTLFRLFYLYMESSTAVCPPRQCNLRKHSET